MSKLLGSYKNGNANIALFEDGSRIITSNDDKLNLDYPLSVDMKITNSCNMGCKYCHEASIPNGKHANLKKLKYITTFHPYSEVAIGGGNILEHPDIDWLLKTFKKHKIISNITVNQKHFVESFKRIKSWCDKGLVKGVGISLTDINDDQFLELATKIPNAVIHVINGIFTKEEDEILRHRNLKMLILGYKDFRRGHSYKEANNSKLKENQEWLSSSLENVIMGYSAVAFDNLALKQLPVKKLAGDNWDTLFQGDDGLTSFYIDAVNEVYAKNSTALENINRYPIKNTVKEMFKDIKEKSK